VLYHTGILFTNGSSKGKALLIFLDKINYQPYSVLMVDDKASNLIDVENALSSRGIPFVGLRYSHNDGKKVQFNPEIAEVQWTHSKLSQILSDEEALEILKKRGDL
jgi:phosphoglycolate phosphatase-like HAD superfamily hydrolase